jgi:hypothetical protein
MVPSEKGKSKEEAYSNAPTGKFFAARVGMQIVNLGLPALAESGRMKDNGTVIDCGS